ncbi:unnamed protein product [Durusdinium trenchii]|uniref:AMP-dependent synthetase/ligase domain-containing protein n=1 Tax=Durusdinium trenchii TaxID=1381693 RepID=A0ABP0NBA2_9DINO
MDRSMPGGAFFSGGHLGSKRKDLWQVQQLEASHRAFAALRSDGRVITWGDVVFGGDSSEVEDELQQVRKIFASRRAFAALREDGRVVTWGDGAFGGDSSDVQEELMDVVHIAATERAFAALSADGRVITWGDRAFGGHCGAPEARLRDVRMIQASHRAFAAFSAETGLVSWGDPDFGGDSRAVPQDVHVLNIQSTAGAFAAILDTGEVISWGHADLGGDSTAVHDALQQIQQIESTSGAFAAIRADGQVITWGSFFAGADNSAVLCKPEDLKGSASSFLALKDGLLTAWGRGTFGDRNSGPPFDPGDIEDTCEAESTLSEYVTKLGVEEAQLDQWAVSPIVLLLSSGMSLEARQAIEEQVAQLFGDPQELWQRLQSVLGPVLGSDNDLHRLRQAMKDGQAMALRDRSEQWVCDDWRLEMDEGELWHFSGQICAHFLQLGLRGEIEPSSGVFLQPGRVWYSACVAAWRLGLPVVPLEEDFAKEPLAAARAQRALAELRPQAVLCTGALESHGWFWLEIEDCLRVSLEQLQKVLAADVMAIPSFPVAPETVLCYVYTGGTTRHSKCVAITHQMALWEVEHYATALKGLAGNTDRMLQYASAYWGAALFGQMDLALAFGACSVIHLAKQPEDIAVACRNFNITVLGIVPSQLRAWPGVKARPSSLRLLVTWAERTPPKLAREWKSEIPVIELLIASEYWLSFFSECFVWTDVDGVERHVLHPLPQLDFKLLKEDGSEAAPGESGELFLSGSTVFAGYVEETGAVWGFERVALIIDALGSQISESFFQQVDGRRYFRTRDRLKRLPSSGLPAFVYMGRADSLLKIGGAWRDMEAVEATVSALPQIAACAIVADGDELSAYLELENPRGADASPARGEPLKRVQERALQKLGSLGISQVHIWSSLPLHPKTSKVNRQELLADLARRKSRELAWTAKLKEVQKKMIKGRLHGSKMLLWRLLKLPYLWTAFLYFWQRLGKNRHRWVVFNLPVGPPDIFLLLAMLVPNFLLKQFFLVCIAAISWLRDRDGIAASGFLSLGIAGASEASAAKMTILLGLLGRYCFRPSRLQFLLGLPCAYLFSFPKWYRDEFVVRSTWDSSYLRRFLLRWIPALQKPPFDASLRFKKEDVAYDWGSEKRWVNVREYGSLALLSFWEPVRPAILPPEPGASTATAAPAPVLQTETEPGDGMARSLALLVARVGGDPSGLSLDSLQAIRLAELARHELGLVLSPGLVLRSADVETLVDSLDAEELPGEHEQPDEENAWRLYLMEFPKSPVVPWIEEAEMPGTTPLSESTDVMGVYKLTGPGGRVVPQDWYVRFGAGHLDLPALQRACDRLVSRHSALRTVQSPDEAMREAMDRAAAMWQLICSAYGSYGSPKWQCLGRLVRRLLMATWPRTFLKEEHLARVEIQMPDEVLRDPNYQRLSDDDCMFMQSSTLRSKHRWPFHIFVYPLVRSGAAGALSKDLPLAQAVRMLPPEDVVWYIYAGITHAYSDGACGNALLQDLLRLYAEDGKTDAAVGWFFSAPVVLGSDDRLWGKTQQFFLQEMQLGPQIHPAPAEPMALLQDRLKNSLEGRLPGRRPNPNEDVHHEILCEDWGRRPGFQKKVRLDESIFLALRSVKDVLGCSPDVAWLTAVVGSLLRLFPSEQRIQLILKCACRDGPNQHNMVGFLSEQRVIPVDVGESRRANLLDVACCIEHARRSRAWRAPQPYEASICVYINIVGSINDGLPLGCSQVCRCASGSSGQTDAWAHLNLRIDQLDLLKWDFRILHWDKAWGWGWGDYFISILGAVIADMVECPLDPIVPAPAPAWRVLSIQDEAGVKRKDPPAAEEAMGAASNGGSKAMRIDADETQLKSIEHSLFRLRSLGNDSRP